jgi:hypothetical protein
MSAIERYTIARNDEEFGCPECGSPQYKGDRVVYDDTLDECFCGDACASKARTRRNIPSIEDEAEARYRNA